MFRSRYLKDVKGRLSYNGHPQYIGETNNLSRREHIKNEEIKFDEIHYSVLNNQSDEERRVFSFRPILQFGLLPPHNRNEKLTKRARKGLIYFLYYNLSALHSHYDKTKL